METPKSKAFLEKVYPGGGWASDRTDKPIQPLFFAGYNKLHPCDDEDIPKLGHREGGWVDCAAAVHRDATAKQGYDLTGPFDDKRHAWDLRVERRPPTPVGVLLKLYTGFLVPRFIRSNDDIGRKARSADRLH